MLLGLAREEGVVALGDRARELAGGAAGDDRDAPDAAGPPSKSSGSRPPQAAATRSTSVVTGTGSANVPPRPTVPKATCVAAAERAGEQRVVADLGVRVERQVVARERDVVLEERAQALGQDRA